MFILETNREIQKAQNLLASLVAYVSKARTLRSLGLTRPVCNWNVFPPSCETTLIRPDDPPDVQ